MSHGESDLMAEMLDVFARRRTQTRVDAKSADYVKGGPFPFVCETCRNLERDDMCSKVVGPYEDGSVDSDDTCRFWSPSPALAHPIKGSKPKEDY